jgi:hypothetical protein
LTGKNSADRRKRRFPLINERSNLLTISRVNRIEGAALYLRAFWNGILAKEFYPSDKLNYES